MSQVDEKQNTDYPVNPDFDPLDRDYLADPYPYYAGFRREAPVFYAPKIDFWVVSRYEDIQRIVKDSETFSNARVQEPLYPLTPEALEKLKAGVRVKPTTSTADPPLHKRTRKHAARAFSARRVAGLEGRIREIANGLIDDMTSDGRADLVDRFAFPLPSSVVFSLIGYPEEDTAMLKRWCSDRLNPPALPFGMVDVKVGASGGGSPLPGCEMRCEVHAHRRKAARDRLDRARRGGAHRRAVGTGASHSTAAAGRDRQAAQRPPRHARRHLVGGQNRLVVAGVPKSLVNGRPPTTSLDLTRTEALYPVGLDESQNQIL